jgi:hypothetical protein
VEIFLVLEDGYFLFHFVREDTEETIADLSLGDQRDDVVNFKLCPSQLVVHLLDDFLKLLG